MFSPIAFEEKVYAFVTQEVNNAFAALINKGRDQQEVFKLQKQMMKALHSVTEETVIQISYGLMLGRPPVTFFRYGSHVFETVALQNSTLLLVCQRCKKAATHDYTRDGQDYTKSVLKLGKKCHSGQP